MGAEDKGFWSWDLRVLIKDFVFRLWGIRVHYLGIRILQVGIRILEFCI